MDPGAGDTPRTLTDAATAAQKARQLRHRCVSVAQRGRTRVQRSDAVARRELDGAGDSEAPVRGLGGGPVAVARRQVPPDHHVGQSVANLTRMLKITSTQMTLRKA
jgi:hypothetical protein